MRFLDWIIHPSSGKEEHTPGGLQGTDSPWHKVVGQLLKMLLVVMWEHIPLEGNALSDKMQAFER